MVIAIQHRKIQEFAYWKKLSRINTLSNRIVKDWNELSAEIVEADPINSFKNKLDKHWIENVYETPFY